MPMKRCDANEHYYDDSKHSSCPFCSNGSGENNAREIDEKTVVLNQTREDTDKTKVIPRDNQKQENQIKSNNTDSSLGKSSGRSKDMNNDQLKTTVNWNSMKKSKTTQTEKINTNLTNLPVTGWLVVVEGSNAGEDFRLIPAINSIGRNSSNTISIDNDDTTISRDKHCIVEYDIKSGKFYLERGVNTTYLNGNRVGGDGAELSSGDIIEIGATKFKFIPFCNSEFCWGM